MNPNWNLTACTCLFSASFTAWLTWFRISLQHSPALFTFSFSSPSTVGSLTNSRQLLDVQPNPLRRVWACCNCNSSLEQPFTRVLGDVVKQEGVLGEPLHLHRDDVFELQPATQTVALSCLKRDEKLTFKSFSSHLFLNRKQYKKE